MVGLPSWRGQARGLHRFYMPHAFDEQPAELPPKLYHQFRNVLRLRSGDRVAVFDGAGWEALAEVQFRGRQGHIVVQEALRTEAPQPNVVLLQALIRPANFELVVQKATELGVSVIQPVVTQRAQRYTVSPQRWERWHRIAVEACEQCGRAHLPRIELPLDLPSALREWARPISLVAYEAEEKMPVVSALRGLRRENEVSVAIGPEGGFEADEVQLAVAAGYRPVSLGPWRLRSETAAIAAVAAIMMALED